MTYDFLQHYWWFLVSLLGALLVFLMFVQGANSMVRSNHCNSFVEIAFSIVFMNSNSLQSKQLIFKSRDRCYSFFNIWISCVLH